MKIRIAADGNATLEEPDDFKGFAVLAKGPASNAAALSGKLPSGIAMDGETHAWIGIDWLKSTLDIPANAERAGNFEGLDARRAGGDPRPHRVVVVRYVAMSLLRLSPVQTRPPCSTR